MIILFHSFINSQTDPKRHLSRYFILTFSSLSSFSSQNSDPSLLFFLSQTFLAFSSHTPSLMAETHSLPLPSCTLYLNQCHGDSWYSSAMEENFSFVFGFGSPFVFGFVRQTSRERLAEAHELRHHH